MEEISSMLLKPVKEKGVDTDLELYDKIEEIPGNSIYQLAKAISISRYFGYSLYSHLIKSTERGNMTSRLRNQPHPIPWEDYSVTDVF